MEYFELCLKVIERELKTFNLGAKTHSEYQSGLTALFAENYDVPYNRCAFMSCYAPINVLNFNDCIKKFFFEYSNSRHLLCEWKSHYQVNVCSLSTGPGLDFLGFMLALIEYDPSPPRINEIKVLSKYSLWQNTIDIMSEVLKDQGSVCGIPSSKLSFESIKIVKTDHLIKCFSKRQQDNPTSDPLKGAHIVLMMKTLSSTAYAGCQQEMKILQMLKDLLYSLRSDAIIFCLDTTASTELFEKALSCFSGKMLYGPIQHTSNSLTINSEAFENFPPSKSSNTFFAWRKLPWSLNYADRQTSFELACSGGGNSVKHTQTTSEGSDDSKDCPVDEIKVKFSEILPWRELPPGKVPWGKIFWENMSQTSKKSLQSLMALDKEGLKLHWIGETIRLYQEECESLNVSSQTNCSGDSKLMFNDIKVEDAEIVPNDQTEIPLTSKKIFTSEDIGDANAKNVFIGNTNFLAKTETFKQCTNYETLSILQNDNISNEITCSGEKNSSVEVNSFSISKDTENLTDIVVKKMEFYPEIHAENQNISIEKVLHCNNTNSLLVDNVNYSGLLRDAGQDTNSSQSSTEVQETLSHDITEAAHIIKIANEMNSKSQSVTLSASNKKICTSKADVTVCQKSVTCKPNGLRSCSKPNKKYSEILPWKELPPGKIPWGEIFWQNSSLKMKKSLKCVFFYNKEILDRHWIGDVARLYIEEFGEPDLSTPLSKKLLYREHRSTDKRTKECPQDLNKTPDILPSIPQTEITSKQVNIAKGKLNPIIALTDNCSSKSIQNDSVDQATEFLKEVKNTLPLKLKENQDDFFSVNKLRKIEHNVKLTSHQPTVVINNIKDKSFKSKSTQTDFSDINSTKNNLSLIKTLTESIQQLTTSFEKSAGINSFNKHQTGSKTLHYNLNTYGANQPPINSVVTNPTPGLGDRFLFQKKCSLSCCFCHCMGQCSCSRCDNQSLMNSCSISRHSQWSNAASCGLPLSNQSTPSSDQSYIYLTSQNLAIPVHGLSDNALLKIMSLTKNS